jgi:hypothetical protein
MSDDETRPIDPEAPVAPTAAETPAYAMPVPPPGYPAYAAAPERPRFADQVMGMRGVIAVALACLVIGGLSGFILGHAAGSDDGRFGRGPMFLQRGAFPQSPYGFPQGPSQRFGQGQGQSQGQGSR